ncbi:MAG: hypothetical protein IJ165_14340 [Proteobacteria bacterium]|nr:hypothetical protein [Pseudomonadota bacterium]
MRSHFTLPILLAACLWGCANETETVVDLCPHDDNKIGPGVCGCGVPDVDNDENGVIDCLEGGHACPEGSVKPYPGQCGCDKEDTDTDGDTTPDCFDACEEDPNKIEVGICGCGKPDEVDQSTGIVKCLAGGETDLCPDDPDKTLPGICGCGHADVDSDGDGTYDCTDPCPEDPAKTSTGVCGCGVPDADTDGDGLMDCLDECPEDPSKTKPGICGCGKADSSSDRDGDGYVDCIDLCPDNKTKHEPGVDGCDANDYDGDGVDDVHDACPYNPEVSDDKEKCNAGKDAQGNEVFAIWHASDFEALRQKLADSNSKVGMPCSTLKAVDCIDANAARECVTDALSSKNIYAERACTECTGAAGSASCTAPSAVPDACTQTDDPKHLYDCCTVATSAFCDGNNVVSCDTQAKIVSLVKQCAQACSAGACVNCVNPEKPVSTGGANYACCDSDSYVETCAASNMLTCRNGFVETLQTLDGCLRTGSEELPKAVGLPAAPLAKPVLRVRLMRDIDFSEALSVKSTKLECQAQWRPLEMNNVLFDGNKKTISFSQEKRQCALNAPLFDVISESRVTDLTLNYDIRGAVSSAIANFMNRSVIQNVAYNGALDIQEAIYGEKASQASGVDGFNTSFGTVAATAIQSFFRQVTVKASLKVSESYSNASYGFAGFIGSAYDVSVIDSSVSFDDMASKKSPCFGGFVHGNGLRMSGFGIDIGTMSANHVFGFVNMLKNADIADLTVKVGEISGGLGSGVGAQDMQHVALRNSKFKVDSVLSLADISSKFYGLSATSSGVSLNRSFVSVGKVVAKDVYGCMSIASGLKLDHSGFRLDNARGDTTAVMFSDLNVARFSNVAFYANLYQPSTHIEATTIDFAGKLSKQETGEIEGMMYAVRRFKFASLGEDKEPLSPVYTKMLNVSAANPVPMKNSWYFVDGEVTKLGVPDEGFAGFTSEEGAQALEALGSGWQMKDFVRGEESLKLPWLKIGDI